MIAFLWIVGILIWCASGVLGSAYFWTKEYDVTTDDIPFIIIWVVFGPISVFAGWLVISSFQNVSKEPKILFKKKTKKVK